MKAIHLPFSKRNPYQKCLCDGLSELGIHVAGARFYKVLEISVLNFSIFHLILTNWKPDVIHLHWHHSLIIVEHSRLKTIIKANLFLFQILIAKLIGIKIVWTIHNLKNHENIQVDLELKYGKRISDIVDKIIVHCEEARKIIVKSYNIEQKNKIVVIIQKK